jgi:hypothetical protein
VKKDLSQVAAARSNNTELYQAVNSASSFADNNITPGKASVNNVLEFVKSNIDVCTNPAFYSYGANQMRGNFPIIGLAAGLAIVEGIRTRGEASAKDLNDLRGAINPFERPKELDASERRGGDFLPIPVVADNLLGPVTEQNMMALADVLMGRFAGISFNTDATTEATLLQNINTSANAADKLTQIRTALIEANQGNGMGRDTFEQGLQAIEAFSKDSA